MVGGQNGNLEYLDKIPTIKFTKLFINGEFVDSLSGRTFETIDPRTEDVIERIAEGDKDDIDLAVKAAREAFDNGPWPRLPGRERGRLLMKFADLIDEHVEEIAALDAIDAGKLFHFGKAVEIPGGAAVIRYYAGAADKIHGQTLKMSREMQAYTLMEPIGVVGHIFPWNFPTQMFVVKVGPALAAGCTMVVKPAEQTPLSALYCAHLAKLAGIPDGVLNVVPGFGHTAGAALSSHMDVDKISFTGSTEVGRLVMQAAATSNLKPVSLELGGKSPMIIFDDVNIDKAVELGLQAVFYNKGEICVAGSRTFVQEGIYDDFIVKLEQRMKSWVVGDPFDPKVTQGPQVDRKQYEKVLSYIELGKKEGATLLMGGKALQGKGFYIEPTIFTDVTDDMRIAKEEIFGPVMSIFKFKTIDEVIKRANATTYGLAAGILTDNLNIANTVSRSLRAGNIWINCYFAFDDDLPFGGFKMSGFGKDNGLEALDKYLQATYESETQQDIMLMRFADYFGRSFAMVNSSQFPWVKLLKESPVSKMVDAHGFRKQCLKNVLLAFVQNLSRNQSHILGIQKRSILMYGLIHQSFLRILYVVAPSAVDLHAQSLQSVKLASKTMKLAKSFFADFGEGISMKHYNLSSTFDELYIWENKPYKEVKSIMVELLEGERSYHLFYHLFVRGPSQPSFFLYYGLPDELLDIHVTLLIDFDKSPHSCCNQVCS